MMIRNDRDQFVKGKNMNFQKCVSGMEAETREVSRGVQLAIDWLEEIGPQRLKVIQNCLSKIYKMKHAIIQK